MKTDITIVTGMGAGLGWGHIQRMSSLLVRLREMYRLEVKLVIDPDLGEIPEEIVPHIVRDIGRPRLILRDMRDSTEEEVESLKRRAKVCVIDDRGTGRKRADFVMDILPHPGDSAEVKTVPASFVYGYNFFRSLQAMKNAAVKKKADFVIYAGALPEDGGIERMISMLPPGASCFLLGRGQPLYRDRDGFQKYSGSGHAEMLLSSRAAITHFGLFLYEAHVSGCGLVSINPSEYHSALADIAKRNMPLTNLGVFQEVDPAAASLAIKEVLDSAGTHAARADEIAQRVLDSIDRSASTVRGLL